MPPDPSNRDIRQALEDGDTQEPVERAKAIRADAFDKFIEEQLERTQVESPTGEFEVVCHVY